jgi:hypothetical protein
VVGQAPVQDAVDDQDEGVCDGDGRFLFRPGAAVAAEAAAQPLERPAPALDISWAVWLLTLMLGIALLTDKRGRQVVNSQSTLVS